LGRTFLAREERRYAGGRKSGKSRCGKTGEHQRPDGNERIDTRPRLAAAGDWNSGGHDSASGFRVDSAGDPLRYCAWHCQSRAKHQIGCPATAAVGGAVSSAGQATDYRPDHRRKAMICFLPISTSILAGRHDLACNPAPHGDRHAGNHPGCRAVDIQIVTAQSWRKALRRPAWVLKSQSRRAGSMR
jgi:hypothetical protein